MMEVELKNKDADTLKEIRQEYNAARSEYHKLNDLRQQVRTQEARCKKGVDKLKSKVQELNFNSSQKNEVFEFRQGLAEMESVFIKPATLFLQLIIGDISVTLPDRENRVAYKAEYEKFKMFHVVLMCILALSSLIFPNYAVLGALVHCVSVWYYFTVTLRELILISNGSTINWWWLTHHYFSIVVSGLLLAWPPGDCYQAFKSQFMLFTTILSIVMALQFRYQRAKMYRKVALGLQHHMSVSQEGKLAIRSLLFGLMGVYAFQLYNAYRLFQLYMATDIDCSHWQVPLLSFLFLILAIMNCATLFKVMNKQPKRSKEEKYKTL